MKLFTRGFLDLLLELVMGLEKVLLDKFIKLIEPFLVYFLLET